MVFKACVFTLGCLGLVVAIQPWLPRVAKRSNVDLLNYVVGLDYPFDYDPAPLPEFIVDLTDYANMIKNDVILLDNSRTMKRGNNKVKNKKNHAISNVPCNCERRYASDNYQDHYVNLSDALGMAVWYPQKVRNLTCDDSKCTKPFGCQKIMYNLTILKGSTSLEERERAGQLYADLPNELKYKWVPQQIPIVAGCLCTSGYLTN
ncbi:prothoracicotropic hormone-like [Cydia strobilella]|uniref:prothoracicotropic hormone-like n=1 Tax=Cydia strobilella TaxID=1100964 RepID=UPI003005DC40